MCGSNGNSRASSGSVCRGSSSVVGGSGGDGGVVAVVAPAPNPWPNPTPRTHLSMSMLSTWLHNASTGVAHMMSNKVAWWSVAEQGDVLRAERRRRREEEAEKAEKAQPKRAKLQHDATANDDDGNSENSTDTPGSPVYDLNEIMSSIFESWNS